MIGGGVLAYTLLGIDLSEKSPKYLILDPHYTGKDDLGDIVSKGWVGWKDANLFKKSEFYNFCLPLIQ